MATRLDTRQDARTRMAIQTTKLVQRLQNFAFANPVDDDWARACMLPDQVRSAIALLKKTLPDLHTTEITGENGGPVVIVTGVARESDLKTIEHEPIEQHAEGN